MTKHDIEETRIETQTADQPELSEGDLAEAVGGLNYTKSDPKPAAVDY
jgi:hypothetical protein